MCGRARRRGDCTRLHRERQRLVITEMGREYLAVVRDALDQIALGTERLTGCDVYVTLEPCAMCAGALSLARIRRLYYGAPDSKGGAVDNGVRFFASPSCHHRPEVYGGIAEQEAAELLRSFFAGRR